MDRITEPASPSDAIRLRALALRDLRAGIGDVALWGRLGARELARRYRRTLLGPLWGSARVGIFVMALGLVGSRLMPGSGEFYVPYVAAGMVIWTFLLETTTAYTMLFTSRGQLIRQIKLPYSLLVCIALWRHVLIMFHHVVIVAIAMAVYGVPLTAATPLALVGLVALIAVMLPWGIVVAIACARFRDLQPLIASILQIAFFVTPVFWLPSQLASGASLIVGFNPAYYFIEIVRAPLLGAAPDPVCWIVVPVLIVLAWAVAIALLARTRHRIAFWL